MSEPRMPGMRHGRISAWWRLQTPSVEGNRAMTVSAIALVVATVLLLPLQDLRVSASAGFQAATIVAAGILISLTIYLLIGDYSERGDVRLLMTASAYAAGLVFLIACLVASPTPGSDSWLAATASVGRQLWVSGCLALAVGLALAWAPWPSSWLEATPAPRRSSIAVASIGVSCAVAIGVLIAVIAVAAVSRTRTRPRSIVASLPPWCSRCRPRWSSWCEGRFDDPGRSVGPA